MSVVIETTVGDLTVDLFLEDRPLACLNFIKLCKLKYYNYNLFHTIEQDFIAQTGDPTGAGDGGTSVWGVIEGPQKRFFEAESVPKILHTSVGLLSLVSPANHLVGSQFFFTLGADLTSLDGQHCVIGEVVEGHETLRRLNEVIVDDKFRPYQDIRITHTAILEDPFPDMRGFRAPSRSPSLSSERLQNGRIAADEDIDDTEGKTMEEIQEMLAEREAKARATILEIVGDLPDAEAAPPENVLFVCKLNPVTAEDDLEIIFSRFGKVVSCEVIRDKKSGDSLQYAFVEFENEKACEAAYFKMDNVLIDDRRIHVDFSQSVARVKWRGKGRGVEGQQGRLDFKNLRETNNRDQVNFDERRQAREQRHRERDDYGKNHSEVRSPHRRRTDNRNNGNRENNDRRIWRENRSQRDFTNHNNRSRDYISSNGLQETMNRGRRGQSTDRRRREKTPDSRQENRYRRCREVVPDKRRSEKMPNRRQRSKSTNKTQSKNSRDESGEKEITRKRRRQETPDRRRKENSMDQEQRKNIPETRVNESKSKSRREESLSKIRQTNSPQRKRDDYDCRQTDEPIEYNRGSGRMHNSSPAPQERRHVLNRNENRRTKTKRVRENRSNSRIKENRPSFLRESKTDERKHHNSSHRKDENTRLKVDNRKKRKEVVSDSSTESDTTTSSDSSSESSRSTPENPKVQKKIKKHKKKKQ